MNDPTVLNQEELHKKLKEIASKYRFQLQSYTGTFYHTPMFYDPYPRNPTKFKLTIPHGIPILKNPISLINKDMV